jgi:uncharacterized membrane protein YfcA
VELVLLVAACLMAGATIGFVGGVLGIGGGLLAIPLLGLVFGMEQQMAQGTSLIMVLPAILMTVRKYNQREPIDRKAATVSALTAICFTWVGARLALGADPILLRQVYAGFVFWIACFYFYQTFKRGRRRNVGSGVADKAASAPASPKTFHPVWYALIGCLAGLTSGVFGVGGSVVVVPLLTTWFGLSQTRAQGLGLTMIIPGTIVAMLTYGSHGQANWIVGAAMGLGSLVMVPYGVRLAYSLPELRLKLTFACMLLIIMILLLLGT